MGYTAYNYNMVSGRITTNTDYASNTMMFKHEDTPSNAYSELTDAVLMAKFHDDYSQVDIDNLPRDTMIGEAEYDEEEEAVTNLELFDWVLEDFGFEG